MVRGVVRGAQRGQYQRATQEVRRRIIQAYENGNEQALIAEHNGVPRSTAENWIKRGRIENFNRGGARANVIKMTDEHINFILGELEQNCLLTLANMAQKIQLNFGVTLSEQTISRHLNGRHFTLKKFHPEPENMNSQQNKLLRRNYVENIINSIGENKFICYIDESNVNLFLRRTNGYAARGNRAVVKLPSSRGANIHMIAALSSTGM